MPSPSKTARLPVKRKEETAVCKINILQKDFLKHVLKKYIKEGVENVKEEF